jgi:hypothetical protein
MGVVAFTYDDQAAKEDLLEILTNISPLETQLVSGLATGTASSRWHQWTIDSLTAAGDNAQVEGADATYHSLTNPERLTNHTQIIKRGFYVTDSERAADTVGFEDRFKYEGIKEMKTLKNELEYAVLRGSLVSGTGSAARKMRGIRASLSLVTAQSGVSLSESILNDYFQLVWTNTGTQIKEVYVPMYLKRKISAFTAGATKNVNVTDKRLIGSVNVYESDSASMVKLFAHRYMTISGDTNYDILGIDPEYFRIDYYRKPLMRELAKTGDSTKGEVLVEATLVAKHYNAGFYAKAHL